MKELVFGKERKKEEADLFRERGKPWKRRQRFPELLSSGPSGGLRSCVLDLFDFSDP